jgi:hypothetical protein
LVDITHVGSINPKKDKNPEGRLPAGLDPIRNKVGAYMAWPSAVARH